MALKISPPDFVLANRARPSFSTLRMNSTVGFSRSWRTRELPSSESLSPKRTNPSSCAELLNIFCWRVSLQH